MTRRNESVRSGKDAVLAEHRAIREILLRLRDGQTRGEMIARLLEFRAAAGDHFEHEQAAGGFFEAVLAGAPRYQRTLEELREEHDRFLRDTDALVARARVCADADLAGLRDEIRGLADRLEQHECRENDILLDVMNTDLGAGD